MALVARHRRQLRHDERVEALCQRDVVSGAERLAVAAQRVERRACRARRAREDAHRPTKGGGHRRRGERAVLRELREARLERGGAAGVAIEECRLVGGRQALPIVLRLAAAGERAEVERRAELRDVARESRVRVLAVERRRRKLVDGAVARADEHPPGLKEALEDAGHDDGVGDVHHLHLIKTEHAGRHRSPVLVVEDAISTPAVAGVAAAALALARDRLRDRIERAVEVTAPARAARRRRPTR